jgi:uncharacterized protein (TIGR02118 family)
MPPRSSGVPGVRHYVQSQTLGSIYAKREPGYDGIAELWYEDSAAMHQAAATPAARAALKDDDHFLDMSTFVSLLTEEVVIREAEINPSVVKLVEFPVRLRSVVPEEFHRYWREQHGPLASRLPQMRRYVQSHARASAYRGGRNPPFDGLAEVWFDSTAQMREAERTAEYAAIRPDEPNFIDQAATRFIITQERVII